MVFTSEAQDNVDNLPNVVT